MFLQLTMDPGLKALLVGILCLTLTGKIVHSADSDESKIEHVFFRQKAEVYTTRSQWIMGLVLDFTMYEKYLQFTTGHLTKALIYAAREIENFKKPVRPLWTIQNELHIVLQGTMRELEIIRQIHAKNCKDFQEIKSIGHSEMETQRTPREKRFLGLLVGGLAGIFSGFSVFTTQQLRVQVSSMREKQETIRTVLSESLSLINLTRMEVNENRIAINSVMERVSILTSTFNGKLLQMRRFALLHSEILTNLGCLRSLVAAESDLIAELHNKVAKLATGRLSPTILPAPELVQILKGIEVEIPEELMLPQDPRERPFYYYTTLTTNTVALDNELIIAIEIPLLDVARKLKIIEAIALPVPYSLTKLTAVYDLEFTNFAISTNGRQYVVLTLEDQLKCGARNINYCSLTSAIQETNSHHYCTLALYQRDREKIAKLCKIVVSNKMKLPIAHYVSDGEWLVATEKPFDLRKHCVGQTEAQIIQVVPPYTAVELASGCRALADVIELPIYFERKQEYHVLREGRIVSPPLGIQMSELAIWRAVSDAELDVLGNLEMLSSLPDLPIEELRQKLEVIKEGKKFHFPNNIVIYILIGIIIIVIFSVIYVLHCKRDAILSSVVDKTEGNVRKRQFEMRTFKRKLPPSVPSNPTTWPPERASNNPPKLPVERDRKLRKMP